MNSKTASEKNEEIFRFLLHFYKKYDIILFVHI